MEKLTLAYWGIKFRLEPIRWLMHHIGEEFNEVNPEQAEWPAQKAALKADGMPFPNLPYLIDGDFKLCESSAIPVYIVRKYNKPELMGASAQDRARHAELTSFLSDSVSGVFKAFFNPKPKEALNEEVKEGGKFHKVLTALSEFLGEKKFFLGDQVTYFDITFVYLLRIYSFYIDAAGAENPFKKFANFVQLEQSVVNLPGIKEHLASPKGKAPHLPPTMVPWAHK